MKAGCLRLSKSHRDKAAANSARLKAREDNALWRIVLRCTDEATAKAIAQLGFERPGHVIAVPLERSFLVAAVATGKKVRSLDTSGVLFTIANCMKL